MTEAAEGNQEQMRMLAFTDADEYWKAERHSGEVGRFEFCICGFEGICMLKTLLNKTSARFFV